MILNMIQLPTPMLNKNVTVLTVSKPKCSGIHIVSKPGFGDLYSLPYTAPNSLTCRSKCFFSPFNHAWSMLHPVYQSWSHCMIWFIVQRPGLTQ